MFRVYDFMTKNPVTVMPDEKISAVIDLMKFHRIHRIPVVNADGKLMGLITEGMIAADNTATSLSIYELNYLLSKTEVRTVMVKHPVYIRQDALMEEACEQLLKHDIGCLPVVDDKDRVTGILTQNDIFKAFLDMLAFHKTGTRLIVKVKNGVGVLEKIARLFAQADVSIVSIGVYEYSDDQAKILIKTDGFLPAGFADTLNQAGVQVMEVDDISA